MTWWGWLVASFAIFVLVYAAFVGWLLLAGRRDLARAVATLIPDCIVLVSRLARDDRVPGRRKLLLLALADDPSSEATLGGGGVAGFGAPAVSGGLRSLIRPV